MKLSNYRVESGLGKGRILTPTTQYRARSVTLLWAHNLLLEGVADRDWGISFSVVNSRINKQSSYRIFILHKSDLWYPRNTIRDQNTFPGAVDCSRREPKKKIQGFT
jgi:hypothetical protein